MTDRISILLSLLCYALTCLGVDCMQHGCMDDEICNLRSTDYNTTDLDTFFCTSDVDTCNIFCTSPNDCDSISIYSAARFTNIVCSASQACIHSVIRIGDTSLYPQQLESAQFTSSHSFQVDIHCNASHACSSVHVFAASNANASANASANSAVNVYVSSLSAFNDGAMQCTDGVECSIYCSDDSIENECRNASIDCRDNDDDVWCRCFGDDCDANVLILGPNNDDEDSQDTNHSFGSTRFIDLGDGDDDIDSASVSFWETTLFQRVLIVVALVSILVCIILLVCCCKFKDIYRYYRRQRTKSAVAVEFPSTAPAPAHAHVQQPSTDSTAIGGGRVLHLQHSNTMSMDTSRERLPSTWYAYKQQQQYSGSGDAELTPSKNPKHPKIMLCNIRTDTAGAEEEEEEEAAHMHGRNGGPNQLGLPKHTSDDMISPLSPSNNEMRLQHQRLENQKFPVKTPKLQHGKKSKSKSIHKKIKKLKKYKRVSNHDAKVDAKHTMYTHVHHGHDHHQGYKHPKSPLDDEDEEEEQEIETESSTPPSPGDDDNHESGVDTTESTTDSASEIDGDFDDEEDSDEEHDDEVVEAEGENEDEEVEEHEQEEEEEKDGDADTETRPHVVDDMMVSMVMMMTPTSNPVDPPTPSQFPNLVQHTTMLPNTPPVSQYAGSDGKE